MHAPTSWLGHLAVNLAMLELQTTACIVVRLCAPDVSVAETHPVSVKVGDLVRVTGAVKHNIQGLPMEWACRSSGRKTSAGIDMIPEQMKHNIDSTVVGATTQVSSIEVMHRPAAIILPRLQCLPEANSKYTDRYHLALYEHSEFYNSTERPNH